MFYFEGNAQQVNHESHVPESSLILDGTVSLDVMDEKPDIDRNEGVVQSIIQFFEKMF